MGKTKAIIIGAGPAGLTAAYELLKRTDIIPVVIEKDKQVGGISKTVDYKGNKMDFGPHRFFSKSDRVMNWWTNIMPLFTTKGEDLTISYQNKSRKIDTGDFLTVEGEADGLPPTKSMLVIPRLTRIYFLRQFFVYPIQLSIATLGQLGIVTTIKIIFSYLYARLFPRKPQKSLEDFMINKFGNVLYRIFFKDYTEKVWGIDCRDISAEWGAQRVKGVSLSKAVLHAAKALTSKKKKKDPNDINQKDTETSLIEQFLYPAQGAGAIWEEVARQVVEMGGKIVTHYDVKHIQTEGDKITGVEALNTKTGQIESLEGDYFISTMPVQELVAGLKGNVPENVKEVAAGLMYRDFVYAGVLVKKMTMATPKDSWIYIQERDVKVARMQVYNNWGPYVVADPNTVWLGLEYFCNKGDEIWNLTDAEVEKLAVTELIHMDLVKAEDVLDAKVNRMEKTYPAYFGTYDRFDEIRHYLDNFGNLFLVGRNGMHKYNNADHSMLTAMVAVDNIIEGIDTKGNLWEINTEQEYHEVKKDKHISDVPKRNGLEDLVKQPFNACTFQHFVLHNRYNRRLILLCGIFVLIEFLIFKYFYPYANYIHGDSFAYIVAADRNWDINTHMIGYSRFLRLFSVFTSSDTILVTFQFLFLQLSAFFFLFSLYYFHRLQKGTITILTIFIMAGPLFPYMANMVSSDCLFSSLSLVWFALLLWIIHKPSNKVIFWHSIILLFAFTLRYNALVYPIISTVAYFLSGFSFKKKLVGILAPGILCGLFFIYTSNKYNEVSGTWQYSPFSGWQAANNALYTLRFVDSADLKPVPLKFKKLDEEVRHYFNSYKDLNKYPWEGIKASTMYMWSPSSPLYTYQNKIFKKNPSNTDFKKWAVMGPFYRSYGAWVITNYPIQYTRYFLWPNFIKYYAPPLEFQEYYNNNLDTVSPIAASWFGYKSNKISVRLRDKYSYPLTIYPITIGMMNVVLVFSIMCFFLLKGKVKKESIHRTLPIAIAVYLLNAAFTIFSSPAAIRLQAFPMILETAFSLILVDWIYKIATTSDLNQELKTNSENSLIKA